MHVVAYGRLVDDFTAVVRNDPVNPFQLVRLDDELEVFSGRKDAKT